MSNQYTKPYPKSQVKNTVTTHDEKNYTKNNQTLFECCSSYYGVPFECLEVNV
jgi:hypothetical protein